MLETAPLTKGIDNTPENTDLAPNKFSLMLVDDSEVDIQILCYALKSNFTVTFATHVDEAIELIQSGYLPDIVLLDIHMPGKNGFELCEFLKDRIHTSEIPIVFLSGSHSASDKAHGFNIGAIDYVTKPYDTSELNSRLLSHVQTLSKIKHLESLAHIDPLTKVANRRKYDLMLADEWYRCGRHNENLALFIFDIDYFKGFNDFYGHQAGDDCLIKVANALNTLAGRRTDIFARYGGEEFVLLLPDCGYRGAVSKAEEAKKLIADLAIPCEHLGDTKTLTISIGISIMVPSSQESATVLFKNADKALYAAKSGGRDQYLFLGDGAEQTHP